MDVAVTLMREVDKPNTRLFAGARGESKKFRQVRFHSPHGHDTDHQANVGVMQVGKRGRKRLQGYRRCRQRPPFKLQDPLRQVDETFELLVNECKKPTPQEQKENR